MRERVIGGKMREWESVVRDRSDPPPPTPLIPEILLTKEKSGQKIPNYLVIVCSFNGLYFFHFHSWQLIIESEVSSWSVIFLTFLFF
jgi:hypothetical protein